MIIIRNAAEQDLIKRLRAIGGPETVEAYSAEVLRLKQQIADLTIEKSRKEEDFARRERELQHMVGLEKTRQEVELRQAKKEVELAAKENSLTNREAEFQRQLAFNTERFQAMETYMKQMTADILKRLPEVTVRMKQEG